jgi:hypothetical protein
MDRFFGLDSVSAHEASLELLMTVYNSAEQAVVESILRDAEIPYLIKERGAGSSVKVITGFSMYGTDIFVRREQLDEAKAIFEAAELVESETESDDD